MNNSKLKCIFMGTPEFASKHLEVLYNNSLFFDILAVYTQPDKPQGRSKLPMPSPVKKFATMHKIPLLQVENFNTEESIKTLKAFNPEIIIIVAFGIILPKKVLDIPKYGAINIHASLLPMYRGASPIQYTLLNGDIISGVTSFLLSPKVDAGSILIQKETSVSFDDDYFSLSNKLCELGKSCLLETLSRIQSSNFAFKGTPQKEQHISITKKISKEMSKLNFQNPAFTLHNHVRAFNKWPICKITLQFNNKNLNINILKTYPVIVCKSCTSYKPGTISYISPTELHIKTSNGCLAILELQPEGKKRMNIRSFLNGYKIEKGTKVN